MEIGKIYKSKTNKNDIPLGTKLMLISVKSEKSKINFTFLNINKIYRCYADLDTLHTFDFNDFFEKV